VPIILLQSDSIVIVCSTLLLCFMSSSSASGMSRFRGSAGLSPPRRGGARAGAKPKQGLDEEAMEEIKEAFNLFDTDGSGEGLPHAVGGAWKAP